MSPFGASQLALRPSHAIQSSHGNWVEIMAEAFLAKWEQQPGTGARNVPPVEQWNPRFCGDIDMRIARDGTWFYCGTAIGRPALVRLFSTILRKDPEGYVLVTPVERVGITVEDAPFLAVEMTVAHQGADQVLRFRTNVEDWVEAGAGHSIRFEKAACDGIKPYIHVRGDLWALVTRALVLDLVQLGQIGEHDGARCFGVGSAGSFFPIANADEVESVEITAMECITPSATS
jgi:hypothetical protein